MYKVWKTIPGDTIVETGESYKVIATIHRTEGTSLDSEIIHALENAVSYTDIEDLLRNTYGTDISVKRISARKVDTNLFEQAIEFKCDKNPAPAIVMILAKVIIVVVIPAITTWLLMDKFEHMAEIDAFKIETPFGETNIFPIIIIAAIILAIIMLMKR